MEDHILDGLARHQRECSNKVRAILVHPSRKDQLGDSVMGIQVVADDRVPVDRFRIDCGGGHSQPVQETTERELVYAKTNV